jgi:predicted DNA-binding transcriptional regulator AlpA
MATERALAPVRTRTPGLRDLLGDPKLVDELSPAEAASALAELASLQVAVTARLRVVPSGSDLVLPETDRLLTAEDLAERFGRSVAWVYRQARHWNFTRRLTRRTVRFSESGLARWLAAHGRRDHREPSEYRVTEMASQSGRVRTSRRK